VLLHLEGEGEIEDQDGNVYKLTPGTMYALDKHDKHHLRATTTMRLICVFSPPLVGPESHRLDSEGVMASGY
jgi:L-ectoine synthase